jgi:hypothetical protein
MNFFSPEFASRGPQMEGSELPRLRPAEPGFEFAKALLLKERTVS